MMIIDNKLMLITRQLLIIIKIMVPYLPHRCLDYSPLGVLHNVVVYMNH